MCVVCVCGLCVRKRETERYTKRNCFLFYENFNSYNKTEREQETDKHTNRQKKVLPVLQTNFVFEFNPDRRTDRQTDRQTDRHTDRQTYRQTNRHKNVKPVLQTNFVVDFNPN